MILRDEVIWREPAVWNAEGVALLCSECTAKSINAWMEPILVELVICLLLLAS